MGDVIKLSAIDTKSNGMAKIKIVEVASEGKVQAFEKTLIILTPCECCEMKLNEDGLIDNAKITIKRMKELEQSPFSKIHGIVLHRTESGNVSSALASWESTGLATHFIVDKDGTIYQILSLSNSSYHVGKIKSRCLYENKCTPEEKKKVGKMKVTQMHHYEIAKNYPERYPYNADAVGIEVVGRFIKDYWEPIPEAQAKSVACVVKFLLSKYNLNKDADLYLHEQISYKTPSEGKVVYDAVYPLL